MTDIMMLNEDVRVQESHSCFLCGENGVRLYQNLRDRLFDAPGNWAVERCPRGHLLWLDPRPIAEDIGKLYRHYFTHEVADSGDQSDSVPTSQKGDRNVIYKTLKKGLENVRSLIGLTDEIVELSFMTLNGQTKGRLLDVGCGDGRFLAKMKNLGWEVVGVEPDAHAAKVARDRFALEVHEGTPETMGSLDNAFDVVTVSHVIEHVLDPTSTLRACRRVLRPSGKVVVITPNIQSLGHRVFGKACVHLDPPRHLHLFSPYGLRACAERAGLRVLDCRTTAREARGIWAESRLIRRNGVLPASSPEKQSLRLRLEGLSFEIAEHVLCRALDVGEEIVLIATN